MTKTDNRWCAAEELKKQAWRFHKQYLTWFQRAASPTAVTDDYEQGPYTYFDWENVWCQRRKTDFRFEVSLRQGAALAAAGHFIVIVQC
jgi:CCR4-NOT transcription complex subunit 3